MMSTWVMSGLRDHEALTLKINKKELNKHTSYVQIEQRTREHAMTQPSGKKMVNTRILPKQEFYHCATRS